MNFSVRETTVERTADTQTEAASMVKAKIEISGSGIMSKKSSLIIQSPEAKKQVRAFRAVMNKK